MRFAKILLLFLCSSCKQEVNDGFSSIELISSKKERLYINSINFGVTGDHQITIITTDSNDLKNSIDTANTIAGLTPFIYSFVSDTLTLYHIEQHKIKIKSNVNSIHIRDSFVNNTVYLSISQKAMENKEYKHVPNIPNVTYPDSKPKPLIRK